MWKTWKQDHKVGSALCSKGVKALTPASLTFWSADIWWREQHSQHHLAVADNCVHSASAFFLIVRISHPGRKLLTDKMEECSRNSTCRQKMGILFSASVIKITEQGWKTGFSEHLCEHQHLEMNNIFLPLKHDLMSYQHHIQTHEVFESVHVNSKLSARLEPHLCINIKKGQRVTVTFYQNSNILMKRIKVRLKIFYFHVKVDLLSCGLYQQ